MKLSQIAHAIALPVVLYGSVPINDRHDERIIRDMIDSMANAFTHNDADAIDALSVDDYSFVSPSGEVQTKPQRTASMRTRELVYQSVHYDEVNLRFYGASAVVTARVKVQSQFKGVEFKGTFRSTLTFANIHGHWRLVASQANAVVGN